MAAPHEPRPLAAKPAGTRRRSLLLGGAPLVVTLASRPALAAVCTHSAAASFNLNNSSGNPISGYNCAVAPSCWTLRAANEGNGAWLGTNYNPSQVFATIFAGSGLAISGNNSWRVLPGSSTLGAALAGAITIQYVSSGGPGGTFTMANGALFAAEAVAALLNASFDATYPNGFALSTAQVITSVQQVWAYDPPAPPADDQTQLEGQLSTRITAYQNARGNGEPCDL